MKFRAAVIVSLLLHLSLFALVIYRPSPAASNETVFYVDLYQLGGGPGPGGGAEEAKTSDATMVEESGRVKDLSVARPEEPRLRYPDKEGRKRREPEKLITIVKSRPSQKPPSVQTPRSGNSNELSTGLSSGPAGPGGGGGFGAGGGGFFPYAYYVETLRNKISAAWYNSLVSPGLRGKFLTGVYFAIQRNGSVSGLRLERESGISALDLSALRAVENAAPFAPLPGDFPSQYLVVHFEFEWEK